MAEVGGKSFGNYFDLNICMSSESLLREVRLTRQLQKTRFAIQTEFSAQLVRNTELEDYTEIIFKDEENRELLKFIFDNWKTVLDYR